MSISRIDSDSNHTHGYYVRVSIDGVLHSRFFQDARHGGREAALRAAQAHDAALLGSRGPAWEKRPGRRNTSGVTGVSRAIDGRSGLPYWLATWMDDSGGVSAAPTSRSTSGARRRPGGGRWRRGGRGATPCTGLQAARPGERVTLAGLAIRPHRPPSAGGTVFVTLEDETGLAQVTVPPGVYERFGADLYGGPFLSVTGKAERRGAGLILVAEMVGRLASP